MLQDQTKALVLPAKLFVKMFFEILFKDFRLVLGTDQTVAESNFLLGNASAERCHYLAESPVNGNTQ